MMERHPHSDPWADKLQQAPVPDVHEAWASMAALLDREMPLKRQKDRKGWLWLILLLLLLIGVCNCPGRGRIGRLFSGAATADANHPVPSAPAAVPAAPATPAGKRMLAPPSVPTLSAPTHSTPNPGSSGNRPRTDIPSAPGTPRVSGDSRRSGTKRPAASTGQPAPDRPDTTNTDFSATRADSLATPGKKEKDTAIAALRKSPAKDSLRRKPAAPSSDSLHKKAAPPSDSLRKKQAPPPDDSLKREKGWMVGLGLNQFFTVGQQQSSGYNSGGLSGTLQDYIPVPMIRYYFDRKLYVQLEFQFNTPQYTRKNLLASQPPVDTLSSVQRIQSSVYIKKLFYFNVPLSVHYSPFDNWNVGAGLQFSRLTNGIGLFEDQVTTLGAPDSTHAKLESFKGDSIYRKIKTDEFRFLLDLSYTYKKFIVGIRYNQALSKFLNVRISSTQVTQARNSSLQLYLRYILWDGRKNKPLAK